MRSLTVKITAVLLLVSLLAVGLVGLLTRQFTIQRFDQFVVERQQAAVAEQVGALYEQAGSWDATLRLLGDRGGVPSLLQGQQPQSQPPQQNNRGPQGGPRGITLVIVDLSGQALTPGTGVRRGDTIERQRDMVWEPIVANDTTVGYVVDMGGAPELTETERSFLESTNQAVILATIGAGVMAIALSGILTSTVMRPLRDLTEAIRRMNAGELEQRVQVRSKDELGELVSTFNTMSADLARANALRKQMTADVAHELRTPLTVIIGYLEGLRDGVLPPTQARFDTLHREALQLQHLVEDLRTLSLADAGEMRLDKRPTNPADFIQGIESSFRGLAQRHDINLTTHTTPDLPTVHIDHERFTQVFANIVSNAIRHTPAGGRVDLSVKQNGSNTLYFTVADTGEGIPPDRLPHIFERFYRADQSRSDEGTGLGLAIARSIVEAHGGTIRAESTPGKGTKMIIVL